MKSYTDIEQSKILSKILTLESADMYYEEVCNLPKAIIGNYVLHNQCMEDKDYKKLSNSVLSPAWSLAALLAVIPYNVTFNKAVYRFKLVKFSDRWECYHENFGSVSTGIFKADNPIDACYEMIIKLNELKML